MAGGSDDADRPDEFGWMYGDKTADRPSGASRPGGDPEPTRKIPTQPRPGSGALPPRPPSRGLPPARPAEPRYGATVEPPKPPRPAWSKGASDWRSPRRWAKVLGALVVLWLVYTLAVPFFTWNRVDKIPFEPTGSRPPDQPGTTYLMVGSDSRAGLTTAQKKEYHTGLHHNENLSDTIMMLHTGSGPDALISFPRDWYVDGSKINGFFKQGDARKLVHAIEQQTGVRIDDYVQVGLGGVAGVVDAVGGIQICPKTRMKDHFSGLNVKKGCQQADGTTALAYARARHGQRLGDLDRVAHQREVVAAIGSKVFSPWSVLNPFRWWKLNQAVPDFFSFGEGTNQLAVAKWALAMRHAGGKNGLTCTMPVTDSSAHYMDRSRAKPLFQAIIEDRTQDITKKECTASGLPS